MKLLGRSIIKSILFFVFSFIHVFSNYLVVAQTTPQVVQQHVLVVHSAYQGYPWTDSLNKGIDDVFASHSAPIDLMFEYLDTKRNRDPYYFEQLRELWKVKFADLPIDLIIVCDNDAYDFVMQERNNLFADIPVVFTGYNGYRPGILQGMQPLTGVVEETDIVGTIEIALLLHPRTQKVLFVVPGAPPFRMAWLDGLEQKLPPKLQIATIVAEDIDHIDKELKSHGKDIVVIPLSSYRGGDGGYVPFDQFVAHLSAGHLFPVYALWDIAIGHGVVGGKMVAGRSQGLVASQLALQILQGSPISKVPVVTDSPNQYIFDWQVMQKFKISGKQLPQESIVINKPPTFYLKYKKIVWLTATIFFTLFAIILVLQINMRRRIGLEQELRKSEERFKAIYEYAPVLINAFDKNGRCLLWNNECQKTFGWSLEEIDSHGDALSLFYPDPIIRDEVIRTVTTDPDAQFREWHPLTKDGRTLHTMWANFSLPDGLTFNLGYDITERKKVKEQNQKLQEELLQSQKMEAIGTLAGGIAHDFNNILSAILGFTELASENPTADRQLRGDLAEIREAGLRARDLVQQILAFSRKTESTTVQVYVPEIINETLKLLRNTLPTSIEFKVHIDQNVGLVLADPTHIHQIMMNISTNAGSAMSENGGVLSVRLQEIAPADFFFNTNKGVGRGRFLKLTFKDTGCGMAPELLDSIFDPYFTTKEFGDGTGLGLAVTHGLVTKMGGVIEVESILGEGTCFSVYLPVSEDDDFSVYTEQWTGDLQKGSERILFVDDEAPIRNFVERTLVAQGYSVTSVSDGQLALERFTATPDAFDLVISDVNMPKMSGDKLIPKLFEIRPDISVILASGYNKNITKKMALQLGAEDLLDKPISREKLFFKVRQVFDGK